MNLNEHGAACRCLLRLRENSGLPGLSDASFINRFLPRFPEWEQHPGAADLAVILEIARELGIARNMDALRDYDRLVAQHQLGRSILVLTERTPQQMESNPVVHRFVTLLTEMDAEAFTLWCPYPSGQSDNLPRAARTWWNRWLAIGIVLSG